MPSGPPELHEKWSAMGFGSGDYNAQSYLQAAGYGPTRQWQWTLPTPDHQPTEEELSAIDYLIMEWDFDGLAEPSPLIDGKN